MDIKLTIRQLLDHAAGTTNEIEAESYLNKAQQLMMRHNIDESDLPTADTSITHIKDFLSPPYVKAQLSILAAIAKYNQCTCISVKRAKQDDGPTYYYIIGNNDNLTYIKDLFANVLFQAMRRVFKLHTNKSEKHNYLLGFASGLARLLESANKATIQALPVEQGKRYGLVSVKHQAKLNSYVEDLFSGRITQGKTKITNASFNQGYVDGQKASLARGTLV